ncbi:MAG: hypothetical protein ACRCWS_05540, partial [Propionibacteriaceae bacterium]
MRKGLWSVALALLLTGCSARFVVPLHAAQNTPTRPAILTSPGRPTIPSPHATMTPQPALIDSAQP